MIHQKISIVVPVYNTEKYLVACITSLKQQTYSNLEIILVDDGSTDDSWTICTQFAAVDSRIRTVQKENGGQSSARNLGLDMATGDYIAFIDSDDAISTDVLEKAMSKFEQDSKIEVVQFPVFMAYGTPGQYLNIKKKQLIVGKENLFREWIDKGNISWIVCNKIFRKEIFSDLRFQNMYYEDNFMVAEVLDKINCLQIMEEGVYYYFARENSTTTSPHSLQKELDTQIVNKRIYASLMLTNLDRSKVIIQSKLLNVAKSLKFNYNVQSDISNLKKKIEVTGVFNSDLPWKEKIKLLFFKYI